ncbi:MAG: hypothetical protein KBT47_03280, partial [Armatimonadetes bacterium]|nr:hypothetical protein [Candidatus Hippobium faecium]
MKKTIIFLTLCFLICILAVSVSAQKNYTVSNKTVSVTVTAKTGGDVYFSSVKNKKTNTEIILKNPSKKANIWTLKAKSAGEFMSPEITLTGKDAGKFKAVSLKDSLTLTWTNVKNSDMNTKQGFDVTVTAKSTAEGTYWNISVTPKSEDYAVWQVIFPEIVFNFEDGQEFFSGIYGGFLENTNPYKSPDGLQRVTCQYPSNMPFQMCYVTQKGSGIYMCPEDTEGYHKIFYWPSLEDREIDYYLTLMPNDQGVGGVVYKQSFDFNISAFDGDWYDGVKKYRDWAIKSKMPAFRKGTLDAREDVPLWLKENCFWGNDYQRDIAGRIPTAFHLYTWWHLPHDVGYPEMLPAKEDTVQSWMRRKNGNTPFKLIYYTNPHLVDSKNSALYQQYGNEIVSLMA